MPTRITIALLSAWLLFAGGRLLRADEPRDNASKKPSTGHNELIAMPTMGGKQFWADELFFRGWRIQRNVLTDHCRLLDPHDCRHTWGTFDECRAKLYEIRREKNLRPMNGRAVVVLHGLIRSRESMAKLCDYLEKNGHYTIINVSYPSTRQPIAEHAKSLASVIDNLDGIEEVNFVGHSLGNIVVRHYLADIAAQQKKGRRLPRFGRMVMLGPPNQGSQLATALSDNGAFKTINGTTGRELGADFDKLEKKLATPPFEFGIIAGGRNDGKGYNPLLPGDDDGTVCIASAHLKGETDFLVVPVLHSFLMNDSHVMAQTLHFLQRGRFQHQTNQPAKPSRQ